MNEPTADVADHSARAEKAPPKSPIDDLIPGGLPDEHLDPLADGILMKHQAAWVADKSPLKIAEKGRRTGFTFAEALDSTLIAASARSAGGSDTYYIPDVKEKGLEFISVCARFARHVAKELLDVEEFIFKDVQPDGDSRDIQAYRIRFASGFQIVGLSGSPSNIRGLQGRVVIDEAAFHRNVAAVLDACNALLIWGGEIRIISTHNTVTNAFNELIQDTRAGHYGYKIHRATFDDAIANGLYERVCMIRGYDVGFEDKTQTRPTAAGKAAWYARVRRSYGTRVEAMREELDAIPREGEGQLIPLAHIEACMTEEHAVLRWAPPAEDFVDWPEAARREEMRKWLHDDVGPLIEKLIPADVLSAFGEDFGMRQDRTSIAIGFETQNLICKAALIVELFRCPYDQQKQALFFIVDMLKRFNKGILDANGNGMVLAQEARQKYGEERIEELSANDTWYREHTPRFRAAFEDRTILIPFDKDIRDDVRLFKLIGGVGKIPRDVRTAASDGTRRHGDSAIAILNLFVALRAEAVEYAYTPVKRNRNGDGFDERDWDDRHAAKRPCDIRGAW
ncbi:MAG: hypothetical protein WD407_08715 [Rhodospirillales bacterium]